MVVLARNISLRAPCVRQRIPVKQATLPVRVHRSSPHIHIGIFRAINSAVQPMSHVDIHSGS